MASIRFMSPHCDETSFIVSQNPKTPEDYAQAKAQVTARRLLRELRQILSPAENGIRAGELNLLSFEPERGIWTVCDNSLLPPKFVREGIVPGALVGLVATLATINGALQPQSLELIQKTSCAGKPFVNLRGEISSAPLEAVFTFPAVTGDPLDSLIAERGVYQGKPLRYILNRYDS